MKQLRKRSLSWFLVIVCVMSLLTGIPVKAASGDITYLDENGKQQVKKAGEIQQFPFAWGSIGTVSLESGWYFLDSQSARLNNAGFNASGKDIHIILMDGCFLELRGNDITDAYGNRVLYNNDFLGDANSIHIYAQSTDPSTMGSCWLNFAAGETVVNGGNVTLFEPVTDTHDNTVTINGGNVVAKTLPVPNYNDSRNYVTTDDFKASILNVDGGSFTAGGIYCDDRISINAGTINSVGGENTPGISVASTGTLEINGGTINATGGAGAAGISNATGSLNIENATVNATGGTNAAGIGGDSGKPAGDISIAGSTVKAVAGEGAISGIGAGAGYNTQDGEITIQDSTVDSYLSDGSTYDELHKNIAGGVASDKVNIYDSTVNNTLMQYYYDVDGKKKSASCISYLNQENLADGWYIVGDDIQIDNPITVQGDVGLIIANGKTLTVNGGIEVPEGSSLTVYSQSTEKSKVGSLIVQDAPEEKAGIGGGGAVSLYHCKFTVTGGKGAAAIGGSKGGAAGDITIGGYADVTAVGGENAAAIGGGEQSTSGTVSCSGSVTVSATAGEGAVSGIGAGNDGVLDSITLGNGSVVNSYGCDGKFDTLAAKEVTGVSPEHIIFICSEVNGELLNDEVENGDDGDEDAADREDMNGFTAAGFKDSAPEGFDASDNTTNPYGKTVITANKQSELLQLGNIKKLYGHNNQNKKLLQYDDTLSNENTYSTTAGGNFDGNREGKKSQYAVVYLSGDNVYLGVRNAQGVTQNCNDLCLGSKTDFYGTVSNDGVYKQYLKIVTGDFDNNGYDEIAVYNPIKGGIQVYKLVSFKDNEYPDMVASWQIAYAIMVNRTPNLSMTVADLTQDGYDDLAYAINGKSAVHDGAKQMMLTNSHSISVEGMTNPTLETVDFGSTGQKSLVVAGCVVTTSQWEFYKIYMTRYDYDAASDSFNATLKQTYDYGTDNIHNSWESIEVASPGINFNFVYLGGNSSAHYFYSNSNIYKSGSDDKLYRVVDLAAVEPTKDNYPSFFYKDYYATAQKLVMDYVYNKRARYNYCEFDAQAEVTDDGKVILAVTQFYHENDTIDMMKKEPVSSGGIYATETIEKTIDVTYSSRWFTNYIEMDLNNMTNSDSYTLNSYSENRRNTYAFVNTDNDTTYMEYTGNHYYTYTNPQILAVLASPPYFKDLLNRDDLSGNYAESGTSYGTSKGTGTGTTKSSTITAGASISFEADVSVFGVKIASFGSETSFEYNYTRETEETSNIEYSVTYSTSSGEDKVVLYSIPREVYEYKIHVPNGSGGYKDFASNVCIPKTPCVSQMNLDDYNLAAANYQGLPRIDGKVLTHTMGDPATYPSSTAGFSKPVAYDGSYSAVGFTGTGGGSATSQEIAMSTEKSNSYSSSYSFLEEISAGVGCVGIGASVGYGWEAGTVNTTTAGSTFSADMQDMPMEAKDYGYYMAWKLFAYESKYNYKGQTLSFPVVSYLVTDVTQPPELPEDFEQDYAETTDKQIALRWSYDKLVSGFNIYRTYEFPSGTKVLKVGTVEVGDCTQNDDGTYEYQFIEEDLNPYTEYQYQIEAIGYGTQLNSMLSQQLTANTKSSVGYPELSVSGISADGTITLYPDASGKVSVTIDNPDENRSSIMYQWQKEVDGDWTDISGATDVQYIFTNNSFDSEGTYRCRVDSVYYDSNTGQTLYLTAYTEPFAAVFEMRKATSTEGLKVSSTEGIPEAEITLVSAKTTHHSAPTGTVTFRITGTNYEKSYTSKLRVDGETSTAKLSDTDVQVTALPDGVYEVTAIYSGSGIFSSYESEMAVLLVGESGYHAVIYNATTDEQTDTMMYGDGAYYIVEQYQQESDGTITKETIGDKKEIADSKTQPEGTYRVNDEQCGEFTYIIEKRPITIGLEGDTTAETGAVAGHLPALAVMEGKLCNEDAIDDVAQMQYLDKDGSPVTLNDDTAPGLFKVSVNAKNSNNYSISCVSGTFEVTAKLYALTTKVSSNGTVEMTSSDAYSQEELTASSLSIAAGTKLTYKATPKDGYKVNKWVVKTDSETKTYQSVNTISFNMPAEAVSVTVYFTPIYYKLTVADTEGGTVNCDSSFTSGNTYPSYTEKTFTAVPYEGYQFAYWQKYVGSSYKEISDETITVSMKDGNVTLYPIFERDMYTLAVDERLSASYLYDDDNDRTTDDVVVTVNSGDEIPGGVTVKVAVKEDAEIAEGEVWLLNGSEVSPVDGKYEFTITENSELCVVDNALYKLQTLLESVKEMEQDDYSDASYKVLQDAIAKAEKIDSSSSDEEIEEAYTALSTAKEQLKTTQTTVSVSTMPEDIGEVTGAGKYGVGEKIALTSTAVTGYDFLGWFLKGSEEAISTQADYNITVTSETASTVHYVAKYEVDMMYELQSLLESVRDMEQGDYSDASYKALQDAVTKAEKIDSGSSDEETEEAYTALSDAKEQLKTTRTTVSVSTMPEDIGEVTGAGKYGVGEKIALTSTAVTGYHFLGWFLKGSEEAISTQADYEIAVTSETASTVHYVAKYEAVKKVCEHKNKEVRNTKTATCTAKGYTGDTYCKDCGEKLKAGTEIVALGHDYVGKVTKEPTTGSAGTRTYTCSRCKNSYTESIPKLVETITSAEKKENSVKLDTSSVAEWNGNKFTLTWGTVAGAEGYDIYAAQCGKKMTSKSLVKTVKGKKSSITLSKIDGKKLSGTKDYRVTVKAFKTIDGKKVYIGESRTYHVAGKNSKLYTNAKQVKVSKKSLILKKGKTFTIKATIVKQSPKKKLLNKSHGPSLRYYSTNTNIATVTSQGKIMAKQKGTCYIYATALNGVNAKVKVTVK